MIIDLDNSKRTTFTQCPRKYYWAYVRHLQPKWGSSALRFGATFHAFLEGYRRSKLSKQPDSICSANALNYGLKAWEEESKDREFSEDYRTFELCNEVYDRYVEFYKMSDIVPQEIEFLFSHKIMSEDCFDIYYSGRIDCIGKMCGDTQLSVIDDKTTSYSLMAVAQQHERSAQMIGYLFILKNYLGYKDVSMAYINASYVKCVKSKKTDLYGEPSIAFERHPYIYSEHDLSEFRKMLWETASQLKTAYESKIWTMNFDECYNKYGTCPYLSLCKMQTYNEDYIKTNFVEKEWNVTRDKEKKL